MTGHAIRMFALAVPGLAPLLTEEINSHSGLRFQGAGFDGRADVVFFSAEPSAVKSALTLTLAEDVFIEVSRTPRTAGDRPYWIAGRLCRSNRVDQALAKALPGRTNKATFRVIVRILQEKSFLRTELRRDVATVLKRSRPGWQSRDPAQLELWVIEPRPGLLMAGFRLSTPDMRQHGGRNAERHGALRPTVAAAMVALAGPPTGTLLDPCCGSGTILAEAVKAGWRAHGLDIDPKAVTIARANVPAARVDRGDVRQLTTTVQQVETCVTNLPFGQQFQVEGGRNVWLSIVLAQVVAVVRNGRSVVLLAPELPRNLVPGELKLRRRYPVRVLGMAASIWHFQRR